MAPVVEEQPAQETATGTTELALREELSLEELLSLSKDECQKGNMTEAVNAAEEATVLAVDAGDKLQESLALCTLTEMQRRTGNVGMALESAKRMRSLCHTEKNCDGEARALVEIARAHLFEHQARAAVRAAGAAAKVQGASAELRVLALCALTDGVMHLIGDFSTAPVLDKRLKNEVDGLAVKAFAAATEAIKLADAVDDMHLLALALHWNARVLLMFKGKEQEALETAGRAYFLFNKVQDTVQEAETLLVLAQAHHKLDPQADFASNAAHDALEIFQSEKDEEGKERTLRLFEDLGIALRVAGGAAPQSIAIGSEPAAIEAGPAAAPGAAASQVVAEPKGLREEDVTMVVQEMAKQAIGLDDELFLDSPLMDSGMDSLTAVSFRNGLQQNLGVKLPSSMIFDYPTMKEVSQRIVELSLEDA